MGNESNAKVKNGALNTAGKLLGKIAKFLYAG